MGQIHRSNLWNRNLSSIHQHPRHIGWKHWTDEECVGRELDRATKGVLYKTQRPIVHSWEGLKDLPGHVGSGQQLALEGSPRRSDFGQQSPLHRKGKVSADQVIFLRAGKNLTRGQSYVCCCILWRSFRYLRGKESVQQGCRKQQKLRGVRKMSLSCPPNKSMTLGERCFSLSCVKNHRCKNLEMRLPCSKVTGSHLLSKWPCGC